MKVILHIAETIADEWRLAMQKYDKSICTITESDNEWRISGQICGNISKGSDLATDIANYIALSSGYSSATYNNPPVFEIEIIEDDGD